MIFFYKKKKMKKLENNVKDLLTRISEIHQQITNNDKNKEDDKDYSNNNGGYDKRKTFKFKNDEMNCNQYNNLKLLNQINQINQMKMFNSYYSAKPENLLMNNQMNLNDSRIFQLLKQNKNSLNLGNLYF